MVSKLLVGSGGQQPRKIQAAREQPAGFNLLRFRLVRQLVGTTSDPIGTETIRAMGNGTMMQPAPLLPMGAVAVLGIVLILGGLLFAIREARLAHLNSAPHASYLIPQVSLALAFVFIVIGWALK